MRPKLSAPFNRSLSLRLLLFAGLAIALALGAAWIVLGLLFERHSERQLQTELERHGLVLVAALELDANGRPVLQRQPADPRFDRPASGLYWRVVAPAHELRSRSLWDGELPAMRGATANDWAAANARGPFEAKILAVGRRVRPDANGPEILVEVAADRRPVAAARAAFGQESAIFLVILWAALAIAAWIQVRLGLRPLNRVREELEEMARMPAARLPEGEHPAEIRPLTIAINDFADRRAEDVSRARRRARDLAHAFKTPITALRLQIETLDEQKARDMSHSLSLIAGAVESELARTETVQTGHEVAISIVIDRLFAVISRTPDGARLKLRNGLASDLRVPMGMETALEAVGALIDNAARHARTLVKVDGAEDRQAVWITIRDDGPGIPEALRASALDRGVRLDERGSRHGLGLSIAQDFVGASGGTLSLESADEGGLCVRLAWSSGDRLRTV